MKRWNPKYYLVFPYTLTDEITWPERWGNQCVANVCPMLCEVLNVKAIGSEIKLIWNSWHERTVIKDNNITYQDLKDYLNSNCSILSFKTESLMKRAEKMLRKMGATNIICVDIYRDVILQQAAFKRTGQFIVHSPGLGKVESEVVFVNE